MTAHRWGAVCTCLLTLAGCGSQVGHDVVPNVAFERSERTPVAKPSAAGDSDGIPKDGANVPQPADATRRIVYRADVDIVVEQFDPVPAQIDESVKAHGGYIAESRITGSQGFPRSGRWTVRIPVNRFVEFLAVVQRLGEVRTISSTSDDVTAEYYDIEARIRNKQQEEERLLELLADATGKLDEILSVERELSRVRGEIEQSQGRLRMMKDVTELTTVTIAVGEVKDYVPEQTPGYVTRIQRAWSASVAALVDLMQSGSILVVALVPWVLPLLVLAVVLIVLLRRHGRQR